MQLDNAYRSEVQRQLIYAMVTGLENGQLKNDQLPQIATQILDGLPKSQTHQELVSFLEKLGQQWDIFMTVANSEMGRMIETKKDGIVNKALSLAKGGNIDDALSVAKTLTAST